MDSQQLAEIIDPEVWEPLEAGDNGAWQAVAGFPDRRAAACEAAERVLNAGFAVVKLPEMEVGALEQSSWLVPEIDRFAEVYVRQQDGRITWTSVKNPIDSPEHALALAAALIAAAQHVKDRSGQ
jgi:hypothetical protein